MSKSKSGQVPFVDTIIFIFGIGLLLMMGFLVFAGVNNVETKVEQSKEGIQGDVTLMTFLKSNLTEGINNADLLLLQISGNSPVSKTQIEDWFNQFYSPDNWELVITYPSSSSFSSFKLGGIAIETMADARSASYRKTDNIQNYNAKIPMNTGIIAEVTLRVMTFE
jgi:hypothetical protein